VARLPDILLRSEELDLSLRWRLVDSLYSQYRAMIDGSVALVLMEAICAHRTGAPVFLVLLAAAVLVPCARGALTIRFFRTAGPDRPRRRGTPEGWALCAVIGGSCTAALLGATAFVACLTQTDSTLQLFVMLVEAAWLAGSTQRDAVSPATVYAQIALVSIPTVAGAALCTGSLVQWVILFVVVHALSARSSLQYFGALYLNTLLTEQRLAAANARLTQLSATDGLTGIGNRRAFDQALEKEVGRAARERQQVSLIMIDVDHFKLFNDHYGHPAGDDCLRHIAAIVDRSLHRPPDIVARVGGEEFAALLPDTDPSGARDVAERIRRELRQADLPHAASPAGRVTISIGVATLVPSPGADGQILIVQADEALYRAKQAGRDTVHSFQVPVASLQSSSGPLPAN
jgi:diguanylate cyclase (GGDEF)-like protein